MALAVAAFLVGAWAVDGINSFVSLLRGTSLLWETTNTIRLATGTGCGLGIAMVLYPVGQWVTYGEVDPRPVLSEPWQLAIMLVVGGAWVALLLAWRTAPHVPVSWALGLTVIASLGLVNGLLAHMVRQRAPDRRGLRTTSLLWAVGHGAAMGEMAAIALLRLWLV
jgi:hypothetical protein